MDAWLARVARAHPERTAVAVSGTNLSYANLYARACAFADGLDGRGIGAGDRVALALGAGEEFVVALHGCLLAEAVAVPVDPRLSAAERSARESGTALVVEEAGWETGDTAVGDARGPAAPALGDDRGPAAAALGDQAGAPSHAVATIVHTSGTTAAPRAIALTYGNWLWNAFGSAVALGFDSDERWLCPLPLSHVGGLSVLLRSAIYGTTAVLHERFESDALVRALMDPESRITLVSLVPRMLTRALDAGLRSPPTLRWALLGGGPIPPALLARAAQAGVPVASTYGMTESCSQIATHGWPLLGVQVRLAGGVAASAGEPVAGEVLVRGPTVAPGSPGPDGWLHTGDLGAWDASGRLMIVGRIADTIVTGAENVAPAEVEAVLLEHPAVADVGVFGRSDPDWGEAVVAWVVRRAGTTASVAELLTHCRAGLAGFKVPKAIEFTERLPRTESGKLRRRELG